jgi:hypothetical protein
MWVLGVIVGSAGLPVRVRTSIPSSARPDEYGFLPLSSPTGFFLTKPSLLKEGTRQVSGYRVPIAIRIHQLRLARMVSIDELPFRHILIFLGYSF